MPDDVYVETGKTKVFASALDWPGWCRSARTEAAALEALAAYAERYAPVARRAGLELPGVASGADFRVVERLAGNATTEFGAPALPASRDLDALAPGEPRRLAGILEASWQILAEVVGKAPPELRKGPRGGGRDRDRILEHVTGNENAYARKIGVRLPTPTPPSELRAAILNAIAAATAPAPDPPGAWPYRYAARRIAWHALDHAWEIEDRS